MFYFTYIRSIVVNFCVFFLLVGVCFLLYSSISVLMRFYVFLLEGYDGVKSGVGFDGQMAVLQHLYTKTKP